MAEEKRCAGCGEPIGASAGGGLDGLCPTCAADRPRRGSGLRTVGRGLRNVTLWVLGMAGVALVGAIFAFIWFSITGVDPRRDAEGRALRAYLDAAVAVQEAIGGGAEAEVVRGKLKAMGGLEGADIKAIDPEENEERPAHTTSLSQSWRIGATSTPFLQSYY